MQTEYVVLDTETTGLSHAEDRIIEIGAVKVRMEDRKVLSTFHVYLNPDRANSEEAVKVHGLTDAFLRDKPRFSDVYHDFLGFVTNCSLVIHNAPFDMGFLQAELTRLQHPVRLDTICPVIDTLQLAKKAYPGQRNTLDALCNRFGIDLSHRTLHGALKDADLLVKVYFAMLTQQGVFALKDQAAVSQESVAVPKLSWNNCAHVTAPTEEELQADKAYFSEG